MKRLRQKLNSSSGVSIILALFFLLVCGAVSAVAVTAASANADRTALRKDEQQAYLAVRSAADYCRSALTGAAYAGNQPEIEYICYAPAANETDKGHFGTHPHNGSEFKDYAAVTPETAQPRKAVWEMATAVTKAHLENGPVPCTQDALRKQFVLSAEGMPDVLVTLTMLDTQTSRYDATFSFEAVGADCAIHFTLGCVQYPAMNGDSLIPDRQPDPDPPLPEVSDYHTVTWPVPDPGKPDGVRTESMDVSTTAQKYKNLYVVTWEPGKVGKGAAAESEGGAAG